MKFLVSTIANLTMWIDSDAVNRGLNDALRFIGLNLKWVGVGQKFALVVCVYKGGSQKYPKF